MKIAGLQKVSTIDYPGEICCVVFLFGCNFRCGFCYNPELVVGDGKQELGFSQDEVLEFLSRRIGKLDGVCISGGEPLMSLDFDFVKKVKEMGFKIKIDTNGSFPDKPKDLIDEGFVDYIAMDVKGARDDYFEIVNADVCLEKIERSIKIVNDFGGEFRTTIVPGLHDVDSVLEMGEWMGRVCGRPPGKIFLQGFKVSHDGMIDSAFLKKVDVLEGELLRMKVEVEGLFGEVGVRV